MFDFMEKLGEFRSDSMVISFSVIPFVFILILLVGMVIIWPVQGFFFWMLPTLVTGLVYLVGWILIGIMEVYNENVIRSKEIDYDRFRGVFLTIAFALSLVTLLVILFSIHWIVGAITVTLVGVMGGILAFMISQNKEAED